MSKGELQHWKEELQDSRYATWKRNRKADKAYKQAIKAINDGKLEAIEQARKALFALPSEFHTLDLLVEDVPARGPNYHHRNVATSTSNYPAQVHFFVKRNPDGDGTQFDPSREISVTTGPGHLTEKDKNVSGPYRYYTIPDMKYTFPPAKPFLPTEGDLGLGLLLASALPMHHAMPGWEHGLDGGMQMKLRQANEKLSAKAAQDNLGYIASARLPGGMPSDEKGHPILPLGLEQDPSIRITTLPPTGYPMARRPGP